MSAGPDILLRHLRRARAAPLAGLTDGELLRRFTAGGPDAEPAFEVLVRRHGGLVIRVCRTALGEAGADDAFQATFLVLVRRAAALRGNRPLGPWLFEVARRVCGHAKTAAARRVRHEAVAAARTAGPAPPGLDPDVAALVHAEVGRLPEPLRAAVVMCDLAGLTYQEAADRLGLPHATVRGRLARARDRLRLSLTKRGVGPDVLGATAVAVPAALTGATARAATVMAGRAPGAVPGPVMDLVTGGLSSMMFTKLKAAGLSALTAGVLIAGALGLSAQFPPQPTTPVSDDAARFLKALAAREVVPDRPGDPAEHILKLVKEVKDRQAAGDVKGARQALRQIHVAAFGWEDTLPEAAPARPPRGAVNTPAPRQPGATTPSFPGGEPDLETRMRRLEDKLDRLIRAMDSSRGQAPGR
ncbi:MAG TPA: sigma-70 family RNA polymerase sigma factor [Gemmataceae bacterium]